jgi:hypothetical protein
VVSGRRKCLNGQKHSYFFIQAVYPEGPAYGFSEVCTLCGISATLSGQENACVALDVLAFIEIKVNNYMGALSP